MALRNLARGLFQLTTHRRLYSSISQQVFIRKQLFNNQRLIQCRSFSSVQSNEDAYKELNEFLEKEVQLEKSAQKYPSKLPNIQGFEAKADGPEVVLTRQSGKAKVTVKFNVTNTVDATESDDEGNGSTAGQQQSSGGEISQPSSQLKSRPTFTVDVNRGGQTLSFLCSYLPQDYSDVSGQNQTGGHQQQRKENDHENLEDFQIDEFAIHDGDWNDSVYSADGGVIDGELYDKLLNLLEELGIGEDFANQLIDFSTSYEHRQYIGLLEKLQKFSKK